MLERMVSPDYQRARHSCIWQSIKLYCLRVPTPGILQSYAPGNVEEVDCGEAGDSRSNVTMVGRLTVRFVTARIRIRR
jgi:hypothetical protein